MNNNENPYEVSRLESLLPQQLRGNSQQLVHFLEEYYRFLNEPYEGPSYLINRIIDEHNIDAIVDNKFLEKLKFEIARGVPESPYVIKAFLLKRIIDFYNVKGSYEAIRYFFRIFFNQKISTFLPWEEVLIPSEGDWRFETKIRIVATHNTDPFLFEGKTVIQPLNGANGYVTKVVKNFYADEEIYDLVLKRSTIRGTFHEDAIVESEDGDQKGVVYRSLKNVGIATGGQNYQIGDLVYIDNLERDTFKAIVSAVGPKGEIEEIQIIEYGSGNTVFYNLNDLRLVDFNLVQGEFEKPTILITQRVVPNDTLIGFDDDYVKDNELYFVEDYGGMSSAFFKVENFSPSFATQFTNRAETKIRIKTENGIGAQLFLRFGALVRTYGQYFNEKGQTSNQSVIQDSFYYQRFSYEVDSTLSYNDWKNAFEEFMHPAGLMVFNRSTSETKLNLAPEIDLSIELQIPTIPTIRATEIMPVNTHSLTYAQDYFANQSKSNLGVAQSYHIEDIVALKPFPTQYSEDENTSGIETSNNEVSFGLNEE